MQRFTFRHTSPLVIMIVIVIAISVATVPQTARAAPADMERRAAAQALYNKAVAAMDRGDYASACPALAEVVRLAPEGLGAKLTLARCYEHAGQLASAWAAYTATEEAGIQKGRADRWRPARERRLALEPKLARLTIVVPPELRTLPGLSIERDGVPVGAAQWQIAVPVDRGKHVITASAKGKPRWEKAVEIKADGERVEVTIEGLHDAAAPMSKKAPAASRAPDASFWSAQRITGVSAGGLGVVGLGVGAVFGIVAANKQSESNNGHCDENERCDPIGRTLRDEAGAAAEVSTGFFVAGGLLLGAGAVLFATAPGAPTAKTEVTLVPGGLRVSGTF